MIENLSQFSVFVPCWGSVSRPSKRLPSRPKVGFGVLDCILDDLIRFELIFGAVDSTFISAWSNTTFTVKSEIIYTIDIILISNCWSSASIPTVHGPGKIAMRETSVSTGLREIFEERNWASIGKESLDRVNFYARPTENDIWILYLLGFGCFVYKR